MSSDNELEEGHSRSDEKRATDLVRLALAFEYQKKPIKREDIVKNVFPFHHKTTQILNHHKITHIIDLANVKLRQTFGMELVALPIVSPPANTKTAAGHKKTIDVKDEESRNPDRLDNIYILISLLPERYRKILSLHRHPHELALLTIIISLINLNGCDLCEEDLYGHLSSFGIAAGERQLDPVFGQVPLLIDTFKRQKYLLAYKKKTDEADIQMYSIGARAKVELTSEVLAQFAGEMARMTEQPGMEGNIKKAFKTT